MRSGGLGVRDLKRLAKNTGIAENRLGLILELASAARLIHSGMPDPEPEAGDGPYWAPTVAADRFAGSDGGTLAAAGHHLAGPARAARADRQPGPGGQTLWRAVGFAVLDRRAA